VISPELAAFLEGGNSIYLGTRDRDLVPHGTRLWGARIGADGRALTVYLPEAAAARPLANLRDNGQAAVAFARPTTHQACQVKGTFAGACQGTEGDRDRVGRYREAFFADLLAVGFSRELLERWQGWPCLAIEIHVTRLYDQTPGPRAGRPL
jgi:hypothetical protein